MRHFATILIFNLSRMIIINSILFTRGSTNRLTETQHSMSRKQGVRTFVYSHGILLMRLHHVFLVIFMCIYISIFFDHRYIHPGIYFLVIYGSFTHISLMINDRGLIQTGAQENNSINGLI